MAAFALGGTFLLYRGCSDSLLNCWVWQEQALSGGVWAVGERAQA